MAVEGEDPGARREVEGAARRSERRAHLIASPSLLVAGLQATQSTGGLTVERETKLLVFKPGDEKQSKSFVAFAPQRSGCG